MKYYYQKPDICIHVFGTPIHLDHQIYKAWTLYLENGKGLIITQKHFDLDRRECWWGTVDTWIANDIYTSKNFPKYFSQNASEKDYQIFELRKVMWALRMKPLKPEEWEKYF